MRKPISSNCAEQVAARVAPGGKVDRRKIDEEQRATHGLAWVLTYVETLKETANWAHRIAGEGRFGEIEQLLCQILFGEYLFQLGGGLPMTQLEIVRPIDMTDGHERRAEAGDAGDHRADHRAATRPPPACARRRSSADSSQGVRRSNTPASTKRSK